MTEPYDAIVVGGGPAGMMAAIEMAGRGLRVLIAERNKQKRKELESEAQKVLEKVGLGAYINRYPTELSGGMQQRLALARVLFVKPKVLLMDEPLSALDDSTRLKMQELIMDVHRETSNTIIMVTHSVLEAEKMCDEIIKLKED